MPRSQRIDCPKCEQPLVSKTGGRCPNCGEVVSAHVARLRLREKRIEQIVAVVATALVLALFLWASGGVDLIEGLAVYAIGGLLVWYWGKGTFLGRAPSPEPHGDDSRSTPDSIDR